MLNTVQKSVHVQPGQIKSETMTRLSDLSQHGGQGGFKDAIDMMCRQ